MKVTIQSRNSTINIYFSKHIKLHMACQFHLMTICKTLAFLFFFYHVQLCYANKDNCESDICEFVGKHGRGLFLLF